MGAVMRDIIQTRDSPTGKKDGFSRKRGVPQLFKIYNNPLSEPEGVGRVMVISMINEIGNLS